MIKKESFFMEVLKDLFFPKKCVSCHKYGSYLCSKCLNLISVCSSRICPECGKPAPFGMVHFSCKTKTSPEGLTTIFNYNGVVKKTILKFKYRFVSDLAKTIIELFLSCCGEDRAFSKFVNQKNVVLIPVPLHWQRKNWRGFNQAELLGKMIANKLGISYISNLLLRIKNTKTQTMLKREERLKNIKNAFDISQKTIPDISISQYPNILLFDDVWTTGATMKEGAKVLKQQGFSKVWGLTLARGI